MKKRKILALIFSAVLLVSLTACNSGGATPSPSAAPAGQAGESAAPEGNAGSTDPIIIGGVGPLTGDISMYGEPAMNGAALAFEQMGSILGREVKFIVTDNKGAMEETLNMYNKLVNNDKAVAVIGAVVSANSKALAEKSQADGIPVITPTGTALNVTETGPNIFRACFVDPFQGQVMALFATKSLNAKTAAVIVNTGEDYSNGLAENFVSTFNANGGEVVIQESYGLDDKDFKAQLTKIAEKKPDVLFIPDYYKTVSLMAAQIKELGITATLLGADGWDGVLSTVSDPALVEGAFYCNHYSSESTDPNVQNFIKDYKEKYGKDPNSFAALGYDAAKIMAAAIEKAGSTDKEAIIKALNETDVTSVTGHIKYDENRNPIKSAAVLQIKGGKDVFYETLNP